MLKKIENSNAPVSREDIQEFCARYAIKLPLTYEQFLLGSNGGKPVPSVFRIEGLLNNLKGAIQAFFGLSANINTEDLNFILLEFLGDIPQSFLPIACTATGDFLCLDLREGSGKVVFWDFHSFWGNNRWNENSLYLVADSFEALLRDLEADELEGS